MKKFPPWLKRKIIVSESIEHLHKLLAELGLHTVCESALCPNLSECWAQGELTFMILGNRCTRDCRFCAVPPRRDNQPLPPDRAEPRRIAQAARKLLLKHIIVTSVTRDDLKDGGASQFVKVIEEIHKLNSGIVIEVLVPDFQGKEEAIESVVRAKPQIIGHNMETVASLYKKVRPQANYERSLNLLQQVKSLDGTYPIRSLNSNEKTLPRLNNPVNRPDRETSNGVYTKSGLMLGLGETRKEVVEVLRDLRKVRCDILTLGQYLQPDKAHLKVERFIPPEEFEEYKKIAEDMGFLFVAAGPWVRSSYKSRVFSKKFIATENTE